MHTYIYIYMYTHAHIYVYIYIYTYIHTYTQIHTHTHIYVDIFIYTHIHIDKYIHTHVQFLILYLPPTMQNSICHINLTCTEMWTQKIHSLLHVSALLECHHQGVLISVTNVPCYLIHDVRRSHSLTLAQCYWVTASHNFKWHKDSLMTALKKCRNM